MKNFWEAFWALFTGIYFGPAAVFVWMATIALVLWFLLWCGVGWRKLSGPAATPPDPAHGWLDSREENGP